MTTKIGEIIEASTGEFTAQCYELHQPPPLGSLVRTAEGETDIYAVVCDAATTGIEPGRRPIARGREEVEEEDIFRSSPQLQKHLGPALLQFHVVLQLMIFLLHKKAFLS